MSDFSLSRGTRIQAGAATVHGLIDDFRRWTRRSPWEGEMRITESTPASVVVDREFVMPFRANGRDFGRGLAAPKREAEHA